mmetsp:Transcript_7497/g.6642  ORF Transcript_7497/g.6642 Transcript_7497/m.6642 type:complete len:104 (+) Transcript_7497:43-354(+)
MFTSKICMRANSIRYFCSRSSSMITYKVKGDDLTFKEDPQITKIKAEAIGNLDPEEQEIKWVKANCKPGRGMTNVAHLMIFLYIYGRSIHPQIWEALFYDAGF